VLRNRFLAPRSGFRAAISDAVARGSIVLCNSVSADRTVMAASRFLTAAAACVIRLSFAAESREAYWSGCIKVAIVICQQNFSILALMIFLLKCLLKSASKSSFFSFGAKAKTQFWSCNFCCYYVQESFSVKKRAVCKSFFCVKTS
jgi:hypothetical protein